VWGVPEFHTATIVGLDYLSEDLVASRLHEGFGQVEGPQQLTFAEPGLRKQVYVWEARDRVWDQETFLHEMDFLRLLEADRAN
jgi:hypothetical protein